MTPSVPTKTIGVLLLNLGGPDSLEDVPRFMRSVLRDPEIIRLPFGAVARPLLAAWLTFLRTRKVQDAYAQIGGKSPLLERTRAQAEALQRELQRRGAQAVVLPAMRHSSPSIDEALDDLQAQAAGKTLLALPLYPQYCAATTGSSLNELDRCLRRRGREPDYRTIGPYHDRAGFIEALSERLEEGLEAFAEPTRPEVEILFSAHGLPESFVRRGDPYVGQVEATVEALRRRFPDRAFHLAYQSRVGPVRWTGPPVEEKLAELGSRGLKRLLVVAGAFVSDHLETLYDIDIRHARLARESGILEFRRAPALNASPAFIGFLADLVVQAAESDA
jgi:ferrochelatase